MNEDHRRGFRSIAIVAAMVIFGCAAAIVSMPGAATAASTPLSIKVSGNDFVDGSGNKVILRGASRTGTEYLCQQGSGIFNGPTDQGAIDVLKSWNINLLRVPLNEHCWLGIDGNPMTGANYRNAITDWITRLSANGIYTVADLHFTEPLGPNTSGDPQRQVMANTTYSIPFWSSVASTFKSNPAVLFELFNEPHDIDWNCLRYGCSQGNWQVAGTQDLTDAVRATGATNPIIVSGIDWGHDMRWLLANLPDDPTGQLVAGQHLYNFKRCVDAACWNTDFKPVAAQMPLLGVEISQEYCNLDITSRFMKWMDANDGDGYSVWAFQPGSCPADGSNPYGGLPLINDWSGTPTSFGLVVKNQFATGTTTTTTTAAPTTTTAAPTTTTTRPPATTTTTVAPTTTTTRPPTTTTVAPTTTTTAAPTTTTTRPPATTTSTTVAPSNTTTTRPPTSTTSTTVAPTTTTTTPPGNTGSGSNTSTGYRVVTADGDVRAFGTATDLGDAPAGAQIVALASTPSNRGYWLAASDGRVFAYGDATHFGDMSGKSLNQPIVGMAATPDGSGYWLLGRDGGIFSFGGAGFYGSTGSMKLNAPVVSMTATPDGKGYWFVASDGGIFAFGPNAGFYGSTGSMKLNQPVVGMASTPSGRGYWLVASDGGIFAFGPDAGFYGSTGSMKLNRPVVGMTVSPAGDGYRFVASDGGVFAFGNAPFVGSLGATGTSSPVVAMGG